MCLRRELIIHCVYGLKSSVNLILNTFQGRDIPWLWMVCCDVSVCCVCAVVLRPPHYFMLSSASPSFHSFFSSLVLFCFVLLRRSLLSFNLSSRLLLPLSRFVCAVFCMFCATKLNCCSVYRLTYVSWFSTQWKIVNKSNVVKHIYLCTARRHHCHRF